MLMFHSLVHQESTALLRHGTVRGGAGGLEGLVHQTKMDMFHDRVHEGSRDSSNSDIPSIAENSYIMVRLCLEAKVLL